MGNSQDHLPLNRFSLHVAGRRLAAAASGFLLLGSQSAMPQQDSGDMALRLRANVVRVEVPNRENAETG